MIDNWVLFGCLHKCADILFFVDFFMFSRCNVYVLRIVCDVRIGYIS